MWFTEEGIAKIGRITTAGAVTEFSFPTDPISSAVGIAAGSDGALWLTQPGPLNRIGRITTGGAVTEFPLPAGGGSPAGIAAGPDGALWFTEQVPGKIGRITTAGTITEFPVPSGGSPAGIAAGPDGALWFTEGVPVAKVGRITTAGAVTEYPLPAAGSNPAGIAAGPDGALWFTEIGANKIGRITTGGAVTEFRVPNVGSVKVREGIAAGPDGALWFTAVQCTGEGEDLACLVGKIGRITTRGLISEFVVPTKGSFPTGIVTGPDGGMWFTEMASGKIGRIATGPQVSLKVVPRTGCTSTRVQATVKVTGGAKLARVDLLLDGRRLMRTKRRSFDLRVRVRGLRAGTHAFKVLAVDTAGGRETISRTFRRCQGPPFTG